MRVWRANKEHIFDRTTIAWIIVIILQRKNKKGQQWCQNRNMILHMTFKVKHSLTKELIFLGVFKIIRFE